MKLLVLLMMLTLLHSVVLLMLLTVLQLIVLLPSDDDDDVCSKVSQTLALNDVFSIKGQSFKLLLLFKSSAYYICHFYLNQDARPLGGGEWDVVHEAGDVSAENQQENTGQQMLPLHSNSSESNESELTFPAGGLELQRRSICR